MRSAGTRRTTGAATRGMALPTALLVLLVLTLLGTAAVFTASTELSIAGNGRTSLNAQSVAEAGIHEALARLNSKTAVAPTLITPTETAPGVPNPAWTMRIRNVAALGANEAQTLTGAFGGAQTLPIDTTIRYKKESATEVPFRCNGVSTAACNDEVVFFHTSFRYSGPFVPSAVVGPPVLQVTSTYTDPNTAAQRTLTVDAIRSLTQANIVAPVRTCGPANCSAAKSYVDATGFPGGTGIAQGTAGSCGTSNVQGGSATPVQTVACPVPASDLFQETFNMSPAEMKALADIQLTAGTQPVSGTQGKIIWISGTGANAWNGNKTYGSLTSPVIIVVEGDLDLSGNVTVYGVVYVMGNVTGTGNGKINGALIVQGSIAPLNFTGSGCSGGGTPTSCSTGYNSTVMGGLNKLSPYTMIEWRTN